MNFTEFPKISRLSREIVITEKLDGTNAQVFIRELPDAEVMPTDTPTIAVVGKLLLYAGSRTKWITPTDDNYGFARWVEANSVELAKLGVGNHFGEWWGQGIQRNYGLKEKRWSLFNVGRWLPHGSEPELIPQYDPKAAPKFKQPVPSCCHVVPVISRGIFDTAMADTAILRLKHEGSHAAPEFMNPEGVVIFHTQGNLLFKKTLCKDEEWKGKVQ